MAEIVLGLGTSHGPMLSTPPEEWGQRVKADQTTNELFFNGKLMTFDELARARAGEGLVREVTLEKMRERHAACQRAIASLAETFARVAPDVAVIIGDDQEETFFADNMPAFLVYWGEEIENVPLTPEQAGERGAGLAVAAWGHSPPERQVCAGVPELGLRIIHALMGAEFDVAHSKRLPAGRYKSHTIPHAYGFIYRRIMNDEVIPNVPIFINTFYPPNQPSLRRCYEFGKVLGQAIASWESDQRVAVIASGGLSHFVIEEDLDQDFLAAVRDKDDARLTNLPVERFNAGSSEMRNWIALAGALDHTDLQMNLVDYVPCYRSAAGTGNAMGFVEWR
jgi:hypothetical protein